MLMTQRETGYNYNGYIICSYRLRRAMTNNPSQIVKMKDEIVISKEIISAVDIHRQGMESVFA